MPWGDVRRVTLRTGLGGSESDDEDYELGGSLLIGESNPSKPPGPSVGFLRRRLFLDLTFLFVHFIYSCVYFVFIHIYFMHIS